MKILSFKFEFDVLQISKKSNHFFTKIQNSYKRNQKKTIKKDL